MEAFDYVFTLVTLVLGLSLVAVLSGLSRALRSSHLVHVGWQTPLLGAFVISDIGTMWVDAWEIRNLVPVYPTLGVGILVTSAYYMAATLVFPDPIEEDCDLDRHYRAHKRQVIGLIAACWIGIWSASWWLGRTWLPVELVTQGAYLVLMVIVSVFNGPRKNLMGLIGLLLLNASVFFLPR